MPITVNLISLGCPKNMVDAENMLGLVEQAGFAVTDRPEEAEVIIVNTCGFIEAAKEESIETVLQMAEYKKEGACRVLVLAGCLGERYAEELLAELPEVDAITGSHAWGDIATVIARACRGERFVFRPDAASPPAGMPRKLAANSATAYLKIAEGCDNACSYCIIPKLRGPYVSRPLADLVAEAGELAARGVKELVLVAQDVTRYGEDFSGRLLLPELLTQLAKLPGIVWIRLLYAYPRYITDELIEVMAQQDKVCKYLDMPLQHINDAVLRRMNRPDSRESITKLLAKLRARMPDITLRTTFIVGFPGETPEEFAELKEFLQEQEFDWAGIFAYSQEEGTLAATWPQVDEADKKERYHELLALQAAISEEINLKLEGKESAVLVEAIEKEDGVLVVSGRSSREAPEVDGLVYLEQAEGCRVGDFVRARIVQGFTYDTLAEAIE